MTKKSATGWNDWPFLTIKQRLLSANEQNGNYIVTAFLGFQAPTGITAFTNDAWVITPTIAGGKGWGDFDIQMTLGFADPDRSPRHHRHRPSPGTRPSSTTSTGYSGRSSR